MQALIAVIQEKTAIASVQQGQASIKQKYAAVSVIIVMFIIMATVNSPLWYWCFDTVAFTAVLYSSVLCCVVPSSVILYYIWNYSHLFSPISSYSILSNVSLFHYVSSEKCLYSVYDFYFSTRHIYPFCAHIT